MKHYFLFYEYSDDYAVRRTSLRGAHLAKAWAACERGELILGGALLEPMDTGILLFRSDTPEVAKSFAAADPYVTGGLVRHWSVREWHTVAGADASSPAKPE